MKLLFFHLVPKLAYIRNLTRSDKSHQLVDNSLKRVPATPLIHFWLWIWVSASGLVRRTLAPLTHRLPDRPLVFVTLALMLQASSAMAGYNYLTHWGGSGAGNGQFNLPRGVAVDSSGNIYVADTQNHRVQKFTNSGTFITTWGSNGSGPSQFNYASDIDVDSSGNIYVVDTQNNRIQKFTSGGGFLATWGSTGAGNGLFNYPYGIALDSTNNVYVADYSNDRIQKFDNNGGFLTTWGSSGTGNGQFNGPYSIAVDSSGNVYVAELQGDRIQKFTSSGGHLATWGTFGTGNGQFNEPSGIAVDSGNNVYVTDTLNRRIQKFDSSGTFITTWGSLGSDPGQFTNPYGITVDSSGNVYVVEEVNYRVQKFAPAFNLTLATAGTGTGTPSSSGTPAGTSCGTNCLTYFSTTAITLTTTPAAGSVATAWSAGCNSGMTLSADTTCTATFTRAYNLTLATAGTGTGTVSSSGTPAGTSCGTNCLTYLDTTAITLTATPAAGSVVAWSAGCNSGMILNANTTCTATFTRTYNLTLVTDGTGTGTGTISSSGTPAGTSCGANCLTYLDTTAITLTATPAAGSVVVWSTGCNSGMTLSADTTCTATFSQTHNLTLAMAGTGTGTASSSGTPAGTSCGSDCLNYTDSTPITLTPIAGNNSSFAGWSPAGCVTGMTLSADTICTATFNLLPSPPVTPPPSPITMEVPPPIPSPRTLYLTLAGTGQGGVTSDPIGLDCSATTSACTLTLNDSRWVSLTPISATGSQWVSWSGDPACTEDGPGKVFLLEDTTCQATFELQSYELTVGRFGDGHVTGPDIECPPDCTETFLYGTEVQLEAKADREWIHNGWQGSCDQTGKVTVTQAHLCQAVFQEDPNVPNQLDGNGDGVPDARQPNVISLPDKIKGNYVSFEVQPDTCLISDVYTDLPENYGKSDKNKPLPQGLIYFELACPQAQISVYYHAISVVRRNFIFQKFGPKVPGDLNTVDWFTLPNVTFEAVQVGEKSVVKATYTITDGGLGDSTGVDGRIVDPGGIMVK